MLGSTLKQIRQRLGFTSARGFFTFLTDRAAIEMNYSYYMKIEGNSVVPSAKVVNQIAHLLPEHEGDRLVQAYCQSLFPNRPQLFKGSESTEGAETLRSGIVEHPLVRPKHQLELTTRQVAVLAGDATTYFLFLILTTARMPVDVAELEANYFPEGLTQAIAALEEEKLLQKTIDGKIASSYPEYCFPKAETQDLKSLYAKLNRFDDERTKVFKIPRVKSAFFFRRISPKYLELVVQQLEVTLQTLRLAEETDVRYNTEVISLELKVNAGKLSG